jgi:hypothetical protein
VRTRQLDQPRVRQHPLERIGHADPERWQRALASCGGGGSGPEKSRPCAAASCCRNQTENASSPVATRGRGRGRYEHLAATQVQVVACVASRDIYQLFVERNGRASTIIEGESYRPRLKPTITGREQPPPVPITKPDRPIRRRKR